MIFDLHKGGGTKGGYARNWFVLIEFHDHIQDFFFGCEILFLDLKFYMLKYF